jgi:hypothetical protein
MDLENILKELREDLAEVSKSIRVLERYAAGSGPRQGRPAKWMATVTALNKRRPRPSAGGSKPAAR